METPAEKWKDGVDKPFEKVYGDSGEERPSGVVLTCQEAALLCNCLSIAILRFRIAKVEGDEYASRWYKVADRVWWKLHRRECFKEE